MAYTECCSECTRLQHSRIVWTQEVEEGTHKLLFQNDDRLRGNRPFAKKQTLEARIVTMVKKWVT